jgi:hypothetical protein
VSTSADPGASAPPASTASADAGSLPSPTARWRSSPALVPRPIGETEALLGYYEYLPPTYGEGEPSPLLVFLNGLDENGDGTAAELDKLRATGIPGATDRHPFPLAWLVDPNRVAQESVGDGQGTVRVDDGGTAPASRQRRASHLGWMAPSVPTSLVSGSGPSVTSTMPSTVAPTGCHDPSIAVDISRETRTSTRLTNSIRVSSSPGWINQVWSPSGAGRTFEGRGDAWRLSQRIGLIDQRFGIEAPRVRVDGPVRPHVDEPAAAAGTIEDIGRRHILARLVAVHGAGDEVDDRHASRIGVHRHQLQPDRLRGREPIDQRWLKTMDGQLLAEERLYESRSLHR